MLLTGVAPFRGKGVGLVETKHRGNVLFDFITPSGAAQRLVCGLLNVVPENRYTLKAVMNADWIKHRSADVLRYHDLILAKDCLADWNNI